MVLVTTIAFGASWAVTGVLLTISESLASMTNFKSNSICQLLYFFVQDLLTKKVLSAQTIEQCIVETVVQDPLLQIPVEEQAIIIAEVEGVIAEVFPFSKTPVK